MNDSDKPLKKSKVYRQWLATKVLKCLTKNTNA